MDVEQRSSAASTIHRIGVGAQMALLNIHRSLGEIRELLDVGKFAEAAARLSSTAGLCAALGQSEQLLGYIGYGRILRAEDIAVGMTVVHFGRIERIEEDECDKAGCTESHRYMVFESGDMLPLTDKHEYVVAED